MYNDANVSHEVSEIIRYALQLLADNPESQFTIPTKLREDVLNVLTYGLLEEDENFVDDMSF